jgi:ATP-binding cassette subfamily B protein
MLPRARERPAQPSAPLSESLTVSLRHIRATLKLVWRSSAPLTSALAVLTLIAAFLPLGTAYAGKRIVDAVVAHSRDLALRWVMGELAIVALLAIVMRALSVTRAVLGSRLGVDVNVAILEKTLTLDLRSFEDPDFYDQLVRARREASSRPVQLVTDAFQLVQNALTLIGYVALLVRFSAWAVLGLVVTTIPATIVEMRLAKQAFKLRNWRSPETRRVYYFEQVLASDSHAKEIKLLGLGPLFLGRYKELSERFYQDDVTLAVRRGVLGQLFSLLATGAFYGAYAVMAIGAALGQLTLGNMTLYVVAFRQGQQSFQSVLGAIGGIYEHNLYMSNLFAFLAYREEPPKVLPSAVAPATDVREGIVFDHVGFRYPGQDAWAVRDVSFMIPKGQSLALVGQNGAGKTTIIKLMTRLYEPTEGTIFLDGKPLASYSPAELHRRFGVIFQDFNKYMLDARENVGVGSVEHMGEDERIARAVDRGGAGELVKELAKGLETPLGKWFSGGVELSGGQWQKVALSRAFMREEADVLILDEPTAALDAEAEHAVFTRFRELAQGRTTIVISHRFPTVRMSDRILFLEHGQIVESGTHDELLAANGRYARLFRLQAEGYL